MISADFDILQLPYFHWDTVCGAKSWTSDMHRWSPRRNYRDSTLQRLRGNQLKPEVRARQTLDQFYHPYLTDTSRRDSAQVVSRREEDASCLDDARMLIVDRLSVIFVFDEEEKRNCLSTCFPDARYPRFDTDRNHFEDADPLGAGFKSLNSTEAEGTFLRVAEVGSAIISNAIQGIPFHRDDGRFDIFMMFGKEISVISENYSRLYNDFERSVAEDLSSPEEKPSPEEHHEPSSEEKSGPGVQHISGSEKKPSPDEKSNSEEESRPKKNTNLQTILSSNNGSSLNPDKSAKAKLETIRGAVRIADTIEELHMLEKLFVEQRNILLDACQRHSCQPNVAECRHRPPWHPQQPKFRGWREIPCWDPG